MNLREAAQLALAYIEEVDYGPYDRQPVIAALRAALAEPQRTWVGLTDAELAEFSDAKLGSFDLCLEVEDKLKEKNT